MKTVWGNIDKTEDKIVRVDWPIPEDTANPMEQVSLINQLLPSLSILQLSDVWLKTKKTYKGKAGKVLVVWEDERSIEFGEWWGWGWGWCNVDPITLTYAPLVNVNLWINVNYILTLTWDCILNLSNIVPWCVYQFLIIQDSVWWHSLSFSQTMIFAEWYIQNLSPWNISKLIIDNINWMYFASIESFGNSSVWRNAWIWWHQGQWVISLSADWINWYSIADKNLGATTVYTSWATFSEANCGKFYQWWNNYWFPFTGAVTTTWPTQIDASAYWPWNYYSSSTFITTYVDQWRDSSKNPNLWWWSIGSVTATQWPCQSWWHIPSPNEWARVVWVGLSLGAWSETDWWIINMLKIPSQWYMRYLWDWDVQTDSRIRFYTNMLASDWDWQVLNITNSSLWYYDTKTSYGLFLRPFKNSPFIPWSWWTMSWWTQLF